MVFLAYSSLAVSSRCNLLLPSKNEYLPFTSMQESMKKTKKIAVVVVVIAMLISNDHCDWWM